MSGPLSCNHVQIYKKNPTVMASFEILHNFYVSSIAKDGLKRKAQDCLCMVESCKRKHVTVHACLSCVYFGCFDAQHIHEHAKTQNHALALGTSHGHVFCFICGDYQYDNDLERLSRQKFLTAARLRGPSVIFNYESIIDEDILKKHPIINVSNIATRGLVNMGNTCYMSVIIQALVHAPIFRDYFLSLKHKCGNQNKHLDVESLSQVPDVAEPSCFACEMSEIVQEFYSGKKGPFAPTRMLYLLWSCEKSLAGSSQQDAHQCFLALINNLHLSCQGDDSFTGDNSCKSVIDVMFTGLLEDKYICTVCKTTSIQNASFRDISLSLQLHSDAVSTENGSTNEDSLYGCLRRALQGHEIQGYDCSTCQPTKTLGTTQMLLKKLPIIISFYLKQSRNKIFVRFPEYLDMSTFMLPRPTHSNQEDKVPNGVKGRPSNKFYLYAVVEHREGSRLKKSRSEESDSGGHYLCYVRRNKKDWFLCDDANVEPIELEDVLKIRAFMLFYHRQFLDYKKKTSESNT